MRIIISPAKKMVVDTDFAEPAGLPVFVDRAEELRDWLRGLSYPDLKKLWACSDDKVVQKGVYAKMARGEMVRYLASIGADEPQAAQGFDWSGYAFDGARSTADTYVFVRETHPTAQ